VRKLTRENKIIIFLLIKIKTIKKCFSSVCLNKNYLIGSESSKPAVAEDDIHFCI
jgi:hypothetical protein